MAAKYFGGGGLRAANGFPCNLEANEPIVPGKYALPRPERFTRKREFLRAFEGGAKHLDRSFVCYLVRGDDGRGNKLGYVVSRKVGKAVVRNRVKRYIREIYRIGRSLLEPGIHVVIVARPASAKLDYRQCEESIRRLLGGDERGG